MVAFFGCENVEIDLKYQPIFHRVDHAFTMAPWDSMRIAINIIMVTTTTTTTTAAAAAATTTATAAATTTTATTTTTTATTNTSRSNSTTATLSHLRSSVHNYDQWHTHFPSCTIF